ncbi:MAG: DeoR/GlpR transcriptional regulator [Clostridia bacterium]|nr:DeoR/GlpR transcriptional regulator [Clostridia bacterium]
MRTENRLQYLTEAAKKDGFVSISAAAEHLGVSIETIRRDINRLCAEKKLRKIRGGAVPLKLLMRSDARYEDRKRDSVQEKLLIGKAAASMIRSGMTVLFDSGVSIQSIAQCLHNIRDMTFITNSIPIASILLDKLSQQTVTGRLIFIGGRIHPENRCACDIIASEALERYSSDIAFVSCTALSADAVSSDDTDESRYSAQLLRRASMTVLIAESVKLGKNAVCTFAHPTDFNRIITADTHPIPDDLQKLLESSDTELCVVSDAPST